MRYSPEHKAQTRERIVTEAGRLFRLHGYEGVGIDTIMEAADLTRGGFYAHFGSKAALFTEVMAEEQDFEQKVRADQEKEPEGSFEGVKAVITGYLTPEYLERVSDGCALASLAVDARRADDETRAAFTQTLTSVLTEISKHLPEHDEIDPRAIIALTLSVGGVILARAVDDDELRDMILETCRGDALHRVDGPKELLSV